jgi:hypothetical protein
MRMRSLPADTEDKFVGFIKAARFCRGGSLA